MFGFYCFSIMLWKAFCPTRLLKKILCFFKFLGGFILYIFAAFGTSFGIKGKVWTQFGFLPPVGMQLFQWYIMNNTYPGDFNPQPFYTEFLSTS